MYLSNVCVLKTEDMSVLLNFEGVVPSHKTATITLNCPFVTGCSNFLSPIAVQNIRQKLLYVASHTSARDYCILLRWNCGAWLLKA